MSAPYARAQIRTGTKSKIKVIRRSAGHLLRTDDTPGTLQDDPEYRDRRLPVPSQADAIRPGHADGLGDLGQKFESHAVAVQD